MWKSVCSEVQGNAHQKKSIPCQDKTIDIVKNGVHVIALADGAGSAKLSHYGACRVVKDIAEYIADKFAECYNCDDGREVKHNILQRIQEGLQEEAQLRECNVQDLASTLLLAAVNDKEFILAHVGDGVIGFLDGDILKVASIPDNGEYCNETTFVTSQHAIMSMRLFKGELNNKNAFVLMSDGTEKSLYHKQTNKIALLVKKLMHRTCLIDPQVMKVQLEDVLSNVISKHTHDDCSIAIIARPSSSLCSISELCFEDRMKMYRIRPTSRRLHKIIDRYDTIIETSENPSSLKHIAQKIHLKPKYTRKYIEWLISLGFLQKKGKLYQNSYNRI